MAEGKCSTCGQIATGTVTSEDGALMPYCVHHIPDVDLEMLRRALRRLQMQEAVVLAEASANGTAA